jgi:phospholipid/cholesterol/gamma-HCH transport system substrate-binding protein
MSSYEADNSLRFKVGVFTLIGLFLIGAVTIFVNDKPFWWRTCQLVHINVDDATGLKTKSPIRSLGLQIGYLRNVELFEAHVRLAICITAPVEVLPATRAYIRGEGFLGDKFVELKPVKYTGDDRMGEESDSAPKIEPQETESPQPSEKNSSSLGLKILHQFSSLFLGTEAHAQTNRSKVSSREIPVGKQSQDVQNLVNEVDSLVDELTVLTSNLKKTFDPGDMQKTMIRLNSTLENASKTFSPEGNLTTTAQRALAKLEDAIEQLRDQMTRMNQGEGSLGRLLNDPVYADQIELALKNVNHLLGRATEMRLIVDIGAEHIPAYSEGRGWFKLGIWPNLTRYYLIGIAVDPRGVLTSTTTTTTVGGTSTTATVNSVEDTGLLLTAMLGKVLWDRLDLAAGISYNDGAIRIGGHFGTRGLERTLSLFAEGYLHSAGVGQTSQIDARLSLVVFPSQSPYLKTLYLRGGLEAVRNINGKVAYTFGAGLAFDDEDIKLLFSFL